MTNNPFSAYNIEIPNKYRESALKYCRTGGQQGTPEFAPFERQVDFWFMAFLIAVHKRLEPIKESDAYNATNAAILGTDAGRIGLMQLAVLGLTKDFDRLGEPKWVFDYCIGLANAGIPYLIQILADPDDRPLWALLTELESMTTAQ